MPDPIIKVDKISKTYHLGEISVPALRDVSSSINTGEFLVITGRNGSGKSTLLRQLGLLDQPDQGQIWLAGQTVTGLSERVRRALRLAKIGYIFQEYALIPELTARENVMIPALMVKDAAMCRREAIRLLKLVGLEKRMDHLPKQLSGGEQQKVAIARSLINDPAVLLADEPTANLDTVAARDVLELFKRLNQTDGHTVVMITHEPEEQSYASRVIQLADGRIV